MNKLNTEFVKKKFEEEGCILLDEYTNATTKMRYICPNGHEHSIDWHHFKNGRSCPYCKGTRLTIEIINEEFKKANYILLSKEYNPEQKLEYMCDKGHRHFTTWDNFQQGYRCPYCKSSKGEKKIKDILDIFGIKYIYNKRIWDDCRLRPDFYLEDYNLVIEYDGIQHFESIEYFGGEERLKTTQQKDDEKNDYCKNNSIDILRILYWEYENIENILKQKLNLEKPPTTRT